MSYIMIVNNTREIESRTVRASSRKFESVASKKVEVDICFRRHTTGDDRRFRFALPAQSSGGGYQIKLMFCD